MTDDIPAAPTDFDDALSCVSRAWHRELRHTQSWADSVAVEWDDREEPTGCIVFTKGGTEYAFLIGDECWDADDPRGEVIEALLTALEAVTKERDEARADADHFASETRTRGFERESAIALKPPIRPGAHSPSCTDVIDHHIAALRHATRDPRGCSCREDLDPKTPACAHCNASDALYVYDNWREITTMRHIVESAVDVRHSSPSASDWPRRLANLTRAVDAYRKERP